MKKTVLGIASIGLAALLVAVGASTASAQGAPSANIKIQSPVADQTVGKTFNVVFTVSQECLASGTPDFIIAETGSDSQPYGQLDAALVNNDGNAYTFEVDATRQLRYQQANFNPPRYLKVGRTTITVSADGCANEQNQDVVVNYQPGQSARTPAASAVPTPMSSPSVTPHPVTAEPSEGWLDNLDPALVLAIGAVAGGGATGLAEYSWIRYRRKHRLKQGL